MAHYATAIMQIQMFLEIALLFRLRNKIVSIHYDCGKITKSVEAKFLIESKGGGCAAAGMIYAG